ncbi:MAG: AbrB/MazE/SpoVT family DNA-binding domain-containing protein [Eubacterium sp.]|jgi:AbrB family transcriptional regulator (stage V sporulation protein T)|nr:AbrB/MazE/SpoVT family DNA-binding domain-containing protein [Eubacterium sp.]MCI9412152.1 AbrB/MazE/SpoVT family DNA-binding domain-containing protein [Eubacterium sp.]MCI9538714.1 AbrB/MazE/SpoVT family DNA-binding domain-containing protein [Eubacterium sp.]
MKATGIVRRIDELGRIVIPKEIRRTLRIREGDPLEIFTNHEGGIILKKYSPIGELGELAKEYVESVANVAKCTVCVADRDQIVAAAGPDKKNYSGKDIHKELKQCIDERTNILSTNKKESRCRITEDGETEVNQAVGTIVSEGDAIGAVILVSGDDKLKFGEFEEKMALCGANFLGRQMES